MTAQAKNAPKPRLLAEVEMANPAVSLAINQALAVMASLAARVVVMVAAKALRRVAHVWVMRLSVHNVMRWSRLKMHCVAWPHTPTAKC